MLISLDIETLIEDLEVSKEEIDEIRKLTVKSYISEVYNNVVELVQERLATSKNDYIEGLEIQEENEYTYSLKLNGVLPNMIESGATSFDMKKNFQNSNKAIKNKNGGWYLTIPMVFRTTNAKYNSGNKGQLLPRKIYDLIRNSPSSVKDTPEATISKLAGADIPQRYQSNQLKELNNKADQYIPKSSIYAGLIRTQNKETEKSTYNTFRRVSDKSNPNSWIHPGIEAHNFFDEVVESVDRIDIAGTMLQKYFGTSTIAVPIHKEIAMEMNTKYNEMLSDMNQSIANDIKDILK